MRAPAHCYDSLKDGFDPKGDGMIGTNRANVRPGVRVRIVQKQDQTSGRLTEGTVQDVLTKSHSHPHGIKVRLTSGIVGRVKEILPDP